MSEVTKPNPIKEFKKSPRGKHILKTQKLAIKYNRCKEKFKGKCSYPHCGCLYGNNGPIDPITGKEAADEDN